MNSCQANPRESRGRLQPVSTILRFCSRIDTNGPIPQHRPELGPCWLWTGYVRPDGYAELMDEKGLHNYVHRISYRIFHGAMTDGMEIDHLCRTRHCVNPWHLEQVTGTINMLRGTSPFARNARVTHCPNGHPYDEANTYIRPEGGQRGCRACRNEARRKCDARRRMRCQ